MTNFRAHPKSELKAPENSVAKSRAPAVNRAVRALRVVADSVSPLGVNAIAREIDVVPSTCLHILRALEEEGLLSFDAETKRYSLGLGLVSLAKAALSSVVHSPMLPKELEHLAHVSGATAIAAQIAPRDRMIIIGVSQGAGTFGVHFDIGRRFPSYVSATGRCVAAYSALGRSSLKRKFDALKWDNPPKFEEWLLEVETARRDGVGIDNGNYVRGYLILAAPVLSDGVVVQSLSIVSANGQISPNQLNRLKEELKHSASRLSN